MATLEEISKQIRTAGMAFEQKDMSLDTALPGGVAEKMTPKDFDPAAVAKGMKVEAEHTEDLAVAENIVLDHLAEDPLYYDKLEEMEAKGVDKATFARFAAKRLSFESDYADFIREYKGKISRGEWENSVNTGFAPAKIDAKYRRVFEYAKRTLGRSQVAQDLGL